VHQGAADELLARVLRDVAVVAYPRLADDDPLQAEGTDAFGEVVLLAADRECTVVEAIDALENLAAEGVHVRDAVRRPRVLGALGLRLADRHAAGDARPLGHLEPGAPDGLLVAREDDRSGQADALVSAGPCQFLKAAIVDLVVVVDEDASVRPTGPPAGIAASGGIDAEPGMNQVDAGREHGGIDGSLRIVVHHNDLVGHQRAGTDACQKPLEQLRAPEGEDDGGDAAPLGDLL
jgi:hypothetical protein